MGVRINSNIPSLFAQRQTGQAANRVSRGLQALASGLRINRAADDAAGLAIAERFRAGVRQLNQEVNSIQSGVNFAQTAEGGLSAQSDIVARIRELSVQAANGTPVHGALKVESGASLRFGGQGPEVSITYTPKPWQG